MPVFTTLHKQIFQALSCAMCTLVITDIVQILWECYTLIIIIIIIITIRNDNNNIQSHKIHATNTDKQKSVFKPKYTSWVPAEGCCNILHYENTLIQIYRKFQPPKKTENFQMKNSYYLYFCSKHRLWAPVNEYPQSMFLSRYKKNNVYPCKPQFYYIKVGFKGVKIMYE